MNKYQFNRLIRHPGYNGGTVADDWLGMDDDGGLVGSAGNIADDVVGLDPNGGGIYEIPVIGDIAEELVVGPVGAIVSVVVPPLAVVRAAQALSVAHDTGKGSLAAVAQAAMAAYGVANAPTVPVDTGLGFTVPVNANVVAATEMALAEGYTAEQVAKTLTGFGDKATTEAVLKQAGYPAAESSWAAMTAHSTAEADAAAASQIPQEQLTNMQSAVTSGDAATAQNTLNTAGQETSFGSSTYPLQSNGPITGTPLEPLPGYEIPSDFGLPGISAGSIPVNTDPAIGADIGEYLNTGDFGADNSYFSQVAAPNTGIPPEYWSTGGSTLSGISGGNVDPYAYSTAGGPYNTLGESYDAGNTPANAGVPEGGWPADYGSEYGVGADIGVGLQDLGLGGLQNDTIKDLSNSINEPYTKPSLLDQAKDLTGKLKTIQGLLGTSGGVGGGISDNAAGNYSGLMQQVDPYWDYRKSVETPLMTTAALTAKNLSGLYEKSYTDPLSAYNTPEMQALGQQFMQETARKDAALGRNSQYGARGVQAQNQFLTSALPQYRTGLNQGLQTMYQAARPQAFDTKTAFAAAQDSIDAANQARPPSGLAGTVGNLQGSWNQMTQGNNIFDQAQGAVNTVSGLQDLYTGGKEAYDTISGWFI